MPVMGTIFEEVTFNISNKRKKNILSQSSFSIASMAQSELATKPQVHNKKPRIPYVPRTDAQPNFNLAFANFYLETEKFKTQLIQTSLTKDLEHFDCPLCPRKFNALYTTRYHFIKHISKFCCIYPECAETYKNRDSLATHLKTQHAIPKINLAYSCQITGCSAILPLSQCSKHIDENHHQEADISYPAFIAYSQKNNLSKTSHIPSSKRSHLATDITSTTTDSSEEFSLIDQHIANGFSEFPCADDLHQIEHNRDFLEDAFFSGI